jgi:adenosylcobinamide-GDP ribazoletransferase
MKNSLFGFFTALRFLTILPVPWWADRDHQFFSSCSKYFCIVGLVIGGGGFALTQAGAYFLPQALLCCFLLFYLSVISGFLHLDGLADCADGFFSARPKKQILEIMHDSRSGAMGVIALVLLLLFKFSSLLSIPPEKLPWVVLYMPLAGRCAIVLVMTWLPYAGNEGSLGKRFYGRKNWRIPAFSLIVLVLCGFFSGMGLMFLAVSGIVVTSVLFGAWCRKKIGGATGDTLGAVCELTETVVAVIFAIHFFR